MAETKDKPAEKPEAVVKWRVHMSQDAPLGDTHLLAGHQYDVPAEYVSALLLPFGKCVVLDKNPKPGG